jgi:putative hydrolase of the HAD superfamily
MILKADSESYFVFDLDDTLYLEKDYLKSAYYSICNELVPENAGNLLNEMLSIHNLGGNAFNFLIEKYPAKQITLEKLLYLYRNHFPDITLREGVLEMILEFKRKGSKFGIITDGRVITQRNKVKALGIKELIDRIIISEEFGAAKPAPSLFESFMESGNQRQFYYIGDNIRKDFITPKKLGWYCIGILDTENVHDQNLSEVSDEYLPNVFIKSFTEIGII